MKIAVRRGHQKTGQDGCASGLVNEIIVAEDYHNRLICKLNALGHEVLDVTPPEANRTLSNSLWYGIEKANKWKADLFISCHVNNAYNSFSGALGCEVLYYKNSSKGKDFAIKIEEQLSALGFKSRGAKADVRNLSELKNTNCPCVIIEPFFVEATEDIKIYKRVGGEGIANAILKGITGKTVLTSNNTTSLNTSNWLNLDGKTGICIGNEVRIRSSKNTNISTNILSYLNKGDKVKLYRKEGDWIHIYYPNHGGYVSAKYIKY
ncbi:N-acetylmuramoyl-L-alanine amidase [Hathewaya limosa]|uniref:N-acetylmuramoyl-L-alanine amidase n=1 Tax=Hathewaya limosa TaxID=1536 RepID=A0ABU0JUH3_HATLI|nr:N-acetylmuramoyl-L-alanine amidase [Hathewaya limosa]MDQ0479709.1 N-acetylmuramoyl-L-alanine amidase [Hathewaya limosa]